MKLVLDTMVVLNFARAERLDLLASLEPCVGQLAVQELRYWPIGTRFERTPFDLRDALPGVHILSLEAPEEAARFAQLRTAGLGAGEAECVAIASCRAGVVAATDDAYARKLIARALPDIELSSTLGILGHLIARDELPQADGQSILATMRAHGARLPDVRIGPERLVTGPRPVPHSARQPMEGFTALSRAVPPALAPPRSDRQR